MNRYPARLAWLPIATALLTGLFLGLLIGWVLWPVEWTDALLDELHPDLRVQYISAVADAYAASGGQDWALALERLRTLADPQAAIQEAIRYYEVSDRADRNIRIVNLRMLAELVATSAAPRVAQNPAPSQGVPWWRWVTAGLLILLGLAMAVVGVLLIARRGHWLTDRLARPRPAGPAPTPMPSRAPSPEASTPAAPRQAPWLVSPDVAASAPPPGPGAFQDEAEEHDELSQEERLARWRQMAQGAASSAEWAVSPMEPEEGAEEEEAEEEIPTWPDTKDTLEIDVDTPADSFWAPVDRTSTPPRPRPPKGTPLYPDLRPEPQERREETEDDGWDEVDEDRTDPPTARGKTDWNEPTFPPMGDRPGPTARPRIPSSRPSSSGASAPDVDEMSGHNQPWERMDPPSRRPRSRFDAGRRTDEPHDLLRIPHPPGLRPRSQPPAAPPPPAPPSVQAAPSQAPPSQAQPPSPPTEDTPLRSVVRRFQEFTGSLLGRDAEAEETLLLEREVIYRRGQRDLEESYPLEVEGKLLGYCGVGSPEVVESLDTPRPIHVLHVWLYELETDEQILVPVVSPGLDMAQARLLDEGHDLAPDDSQTLPHVEARPGASFELATTHLHLTGTVVEATVQPPGEAGAPLQTVHLRLQVWHRA